MRDERRKRADGRRGMMGRFAVPFYLLSLISYLFLACSSAPKGPVETRTQRRSAAAQLEIADREADRGNYAAALVLADEARRYAVAADDPALIVRTALSRGTILSYLGRAAEAQEAFAGALAEAERTGDPEIAAASRIYAARIRLLNDSSNAAEIRDQARKELSLIKKDDAALALGWTVIGLAEKELGHWADAEKGIKAALDIHAKGNSLEQAAYDWYLIASIRSVSGQYPAALNALEEALAYDRRAENAYGLGTDWKAMGDVHAKAGNAAAADLAYHRSAEIFEAMGLGKAGAQ